MSENTTKQDHLYRPCVGIMLLNDRGLVWIGRRTDIDNDEGSGLWWQMPQGGIDDNEGSRRRGPFATLRGDLGQKSARIMAEAPGWYRYDLPPHLIGIAWGGRWRGQRQKWYAARFEGKDDEIDISAPPGPDKAEFDDWRWAGMDELDSVIVPFKRAVYKDVVAAFRHFAA